MKRIESLVRPNIRAMVPYSTARDEFKGVAEVFMDANESPFDNGYNRYPDPSQARLKRRIAEIKGVDVQNIFVGNGSDEAIDLCFRIFCNPGLDNAIAIAPSYGMYSTCAAVNDVEMREVLLNDDFSLPVERLLDAADDNSKLLFICSPNNPTGNVFPREEIERILQEFDGMVVLDEAYIDFADEPGMLRSLENWPNLIILQTLSKAWGMAGLRAGLAFASNYVMQLFAEIRITSSCSPWFNPLGFDSHLAHILSNSALRNTFSGFTEFFGDFWSTIVLVRIIIDMLDLLFNSSFSLSGR